MHKVSCGLTIKVNQHLILCVKDTHARYARGLLCRRCWRNQPHVPLFKLLPPRMVGEARHVDRYRWGAGRGKHSARYWLPRVPLCNLGGVREGAFCHIRRCRIPDLHRPRYLRHEGRLVRWKTVWYSRWIRQPPNRHRLWSHLQGMESADTFIVPEHSGARESAERYLTQRWLRVVNRRSWQVESG